jgi:CheY-like chemotaxis protein
MRKPQVLSIFKKKPAQTLTPERPGANQAPAPAPTRKSTKQQMISVFPPQEAGNADMSGKLEALKSKINPPETEVVHLEHLKTDHFETYFPSEAPEPKPATVYVARPVAATKQATPMHAERPAPKPVARAATAPVRSERRAKRRALISAPVRVRSLGLTRNYLDDVTTTLNVSRQGILLASRNRAYHRNMDVLVTFPYSKAPNSIHAEQPGRVLDVSEFSDGRVAVAITLDVSKRDEEFIRANGEKVHAKSDRPEGTVDRARNSSRPLVLILDSDAGARTDLEKYLAKEGYNVISVTNAHEARDMLTRWTPSLLIAEIEGQGKPGYEICDHCKSTPRLQKIPIILTTNSAYPSDYANAHSRGAMVCLAKPYRLERLGHVAKLLSPVPTRGDEHDR